MLTRFVSPVISLMRSQQSAFQRNRWKVARADGATPTHQIDAIIASLTPSRPHSMELDGLSFSIFRLRTDGTLHFVEEAQSLDDAKRARTKTGRIMARRVHHF